MHPYVDVLKIDLPSFNSHSDNILTWEHASSKNDNEQKVKTAIKLLRHLLN